MKVLEEVLHWWPMIWPLLAGAVGWLAKAVVDYRRRDEEEAERAEADRKSIENLTNQVGEMRADLDAIKAGNVAQYQESIMSAHTRYCNHGVKLTLASRGRVNAMMRSLSALDDEDGSFKAMVDEINQLPIWQPDER